MRKAEPSIEKTRAGEVEARQALERFGCGHVVRSMRSRRVRYTPSVPYSLLVVLSALLFAAARPRQPPAAKKEASAKKEAGVHYKRGVDFYKENNFSAALAEFKAAYQAAPSFEVLFNIGLSERRLFKYGQALRTLNKYLRGRRREGAEGAPGRGGAGDSSSSARSPRPSPSS